MSWWQNLFKKSAKQTRASPAEIRQQPQAVWRSDAEDIHVILPSSTAVSSSQRPRVEYDVRRDTGGGTAAYQVISLILKIVRLPFDFVFFWFKTVFWILYYRPGGMASDRMIMLGTFIIVTVLALIQVLIGKDIPLQYREIAYLMIIVLAIYLIGLHHYRDIKYFRAPYYRRERKRRR